MNYLYEQNSVLRSADWSKRLDKSWSTYPDPLGRLPEVNHYNFAISPNRVKKVNRYLRFMNTRIRKYMAVDKPKALSIWVIMLRMSLSYQLVLFHRAKSNWYWSVSEKTAIKEFTKLRNELRKGNLSTDIKRYYIEKKPELNLPDYQKKWRPIGAPSWVSKAKTKAITDMVACMTHDIQPEFQHAYRHNRGIYTAVKQIIDYINQGYEYVLEFDLKGFFNNVRYRDIELYLKSVDTKLNALVMNVIAKINYTVETYRIRPIWTAIEANKKAKYFDAIKDQWRNFNLKTKQRKGNWLEPKLMAEDELILDPTREKTIARSGMPQGLGFSAIVATVCNPLNVFKLKKVLFADDGVILHKTEKERQETFTGLRSWYMRGVLVSWEKTRLVKDQFKFLGLIFDVTHKIIYFPLAGKVNFKTPVIRFEDPKLKEWIESVVTEYKKEAKKWTWYIQPESFIMRTRFIMPWTTRIITLWKGILRGERYKQYRAIYTRALYWKIVDIAGSSTYSLDILLQAIKNRKYRKLKKLKLIQVRYDLDNIMKMKKKGKVQGSKYVEYLYDKTQDKEKNYDQMMRLGCNLQNLKEWNMEFTKWCEYANNPKNSAAMDEFVLHRTQWYKDPRQG